MAPHLGVHVYFVSKSVALRSANRIRVVRNIYLSQECVRLLRVTVLVMRCYLRLPHRE